MTGVVAVGALAGAVLGGVWWPVPEASVTAPQHAHVVTPEHEWAARAGARAESARAALAAAEAAKVAGTEPDTANPVVVRIRSLQGELMDAETKRLGRESAAAVSESAEEHAAQHREDLLRITYESELAALPKAEQDAVRVGLLKSEAELDERVYQMAAVREKEAASAVETQPWTKSAWAAEAMHLGPFGVGGGLLGLAFGLGLFAFWDGRSNRPVRDDVPHGLSWAEEVAIGAGESRVEAMQPLDPPDEVASSTSVVPLPVEPERLPPQVHEASPEALPELEVEVARHGAVPAVPGNSRGLARVINQDVDSEFPQSRDVFLGTQWGESPARLEEACRDAVYSVLLADWGKGVRSYAVVSPRDGDGKTTVVANMAVALGRAEVRVVVVEGNLRRPRLQEMFDVWSRVGVRDVLRGDVDLETASIDEITNRTTLSHVAVVLAGAGEDEPEGWAQSAGFAKLMERLAYAFDLVLVDTSTEEAANVAKLCGGAILLLRSGNNGQEEAETLRRGLMDKGVCIAGVVLNEFDGANGVGAL